MIKPMDLAGLLALVAGFGLIVAGAFMASVIAGVFVLGGLLALTGVALLYAAFAREARAKANGQHATGGAGMRSVA